MVTSTLDEKGGPEIIPRVSFPWEWGQVSSWALRSWNVTLGLEILSDACQARDQVSPAAQLITQNFLYWLSPETLHDSFKVGLILFNRRYFLPSQLDFSWSFKRACLCMHTGDLAHTFYFPCSEPSERLSVSSNTMSQNCTTTMVRICHFPKFWIWSAGKACILWHCWLSHLSWELQADEVSALCCWWATVWWAMGKIGSTWHNSPYGVVFRDSENHEYSQTFLTINILDNYSVLA